MMILGPADGGDVEEEKHIHCSTLAMKHKEERRRGELGCMRLPPQNHHPGLLFGSVL